MPKDFQIIHFMISALRKRIPGILMPPNYNNYVFFSFFYLVFIEYHILLDEYILRDFLSIN